MSDADALTALQEEVTRLRAELAALRAGLLPRLITADGFIQHYRVVWADPPDPDEDR